MKITKEEFDSLYSSTILKSEYDRIIRQINTRFSEVVRLVCGGRGWFTYGNYDDNSEGDDGEFDLDKYKTDIDVSGSCDFPSPYLNVYEGRGRIPTRWLWTDDADILVEFNGEVEKAKLALEQKKLANKQRRLAEKIKHKLFAEKRDEMQKSIKSKLTPEELRYIHFR